MPLASPLSATINAAPAPLEITLPNSILNGLVLPDSAMVLIPGEAILSRRITSVLLLCTEPTSGEK